jgi:hypothetical protein
LIKATFWKKAVLVFIGELFGTADLSRMKPSNVQRIVQKTLERTKKNENKCEIKQQKHAKHATKYKQNFANHKKNAFIYIISRRTSGSVPLATGQRSAVVDTDQKGCGSPASSWNMQASVYTQY